MTTISTRYHEETLETNNNRIKPEDLFSSIKNENKKLLEYIEKGDKNTEFLKDCFNKILDNLSKKDGREHCPNC